ncbi:hypothetical protein CONLIGDRAFT_671924 [Coniochaeta ligniaria NRRL 30616]|uniref:Uncharacterized protein n=1 Tax=Coniochaeta ligniaria NRRL 30616 TaxID=1408157 RepID=A0A1J7J959_9PEZI|nr:hypothetical protein CONLIGDRAFT_671924 [Coniochaeta ligniaria NRRL 30616]
MWHIEFASAIKGKALVASIAIQSTPAATTATWKPRPRDAPSLPGLQDRILVEELRKNYADTRKMKQILRSFFPYVLCLVSLAAWFMFLSLGSFLHFPSSDSEGHQFEY